MSRLAIVGAGVSGLAAAWALRDTDIDITLFEKSRGFSGRAATRGGDGIRYDHGANYISIESDSVRRVLHEALPSDELVEVEGNVWTFDEFGVIEPGDPDSNADPKWTYRSGISTLGKLLAEQADAEVLRQTRVRRLDRTSPTWHVEDTEGMRFGPFDAVLLTPPAPQSRKIVADSAWAAPAKGTVESGLAAAAYQSQFTVVLGCSAPVERPDGCYALLNTDRAHPIAWLSFEEDKPGHVPEGQSVLIVQMSPEWTADHFDAGHDTLVAEVRPLVETLLETPLPPLEWSDHQRWRYALPTSAVDTEALREGEEAGLFFAGDMLVGKGRVGRALQTGLEVAPRVKSHLERLPQA
jgi:hypothetical protein